MQSNSDSFHDDFTSEVEVTRRHTLRMLGLGAGAVLLGSADLQAAPSIPALFHPTNGVGNVILAFGTEWKWATSTCDGKYKRHAGVDIGGAAVAGTAVYAAFDGTVKIKFVDTKGWKGCVVIEHSDSKGNKFTTTYWHINYSVGTTVKKGDKIGEIADLGGLTTNHLHYGLRAAPYSAVAQRGALPYTMACDGDPQFPEWFLRGL